MKPEDLKRRVLDLRAVSMEHLPAPDEPILEQHGRLICDDCGRVVTVDVTTGVAHEAIADWTRRDGLDFCGDCS